VLGGGPAGLAAAIDLRARGDLRVVVAEAREEPAERFGESLPPGILVALDRLGLSGAFRADGHLPCPGSISAWGAEKPGHNDFIANATGPGWHIDRARFETMLRARAAEAGASIRPGTRAVAASRGGEGFEVELEDRAGRRTLGAARVLDATGMRAWFARRQGATRRTHDRMIAVVRFADIRDGPFTAQTVVEATREGWWYAARLPDDRLVTLLVAEGRQARALTVGGYAGWRRQLASTRLLAPRLDACRLAGERFGSRPVASSILDRVEGAGWLAVGDAASAWDPLAAQGIHKALVDAADAARTLVAAAGRGEPPPWRYADRVGTRFEEYRADRARLYALEQRWPDAPFWRHRAEA
jgi:flavin-dependent dehydrogenase